jgi:hypothetical protein
MRTASSIVAFLALALAGTPAVQAETARPESPNLPLRGTPAEKLFKAPHPTCRAWNDGCISCVSSESGPAHCIDISMFCTPHAIVCTREQEVEPRRPD